MVERPMVGKIGGDIGWEEPLPRLIFVTADKVL